MEENKMGKIARNVTSGGKGANHWAPCPTARNMLAMIPPGSAARTAATGMNKAEKIHSVTLQSGQDCTLSSPLAVSVAIASKHGEKLMNISEAEMANNKEVTAAGTLCSWET